MNFYMTKQKKVLVDLCRCANEAKKIVAEYDKLCRETAPRSFSVS